MRRHPVATRRSPLPRQRDTQDVLGDRPFPGLELSGERLRATVESAERRQRERPGEGRARRSDPETSRIAATSITPRDLVGVMRADYELLAVRPMTDDELFAAYLDAGYPRRTRQRIATARSDLTKRGLVRWTGRFGLSLNGKPARVWEVAE